MTEPRQPEDPPPPDHSKKPGIEDKEHAPNGIPPGAGEAEAKGSPHSDRQQSEVAANKG